MLRELFEAIGTQAVKAAVPTTLRPDAEPKHVYYLRTAGGTLEHHEASPEPRQHRAGDIATIARLGSLLDGPTPVIWYSRVGVTLLIDDDTRRDRVHLPFEFSPQMTLLQAMEKSQQWSNQATFLSLLRVKLAGSMGHHPSLIPSLRKIKFKQTAEGGSEIVQAKASVGKSISAELSGAEPLPDELTLCLPVFNGRQERATILCSLDIDPEKQLFSLTPMAGEIEEAVRQAEAKVREVIAQEMEVVSLECPVYYGTP